MTATLPPTAAKVSPTATLTKTTVPPNQAFKPPFSASQRGEWRDAIWADMDNWRKLDLFKDYKNPLGFSPVVLPPGPYDDEGPIVIGIDCPEKLQPVSEIIRKRLAATGIPLEMVKFEHIGLTRLDALGYNHLKICGDPHPAGFGGYFLEPRDTNTFYVYLLHPSQEAAEEMMDFQLTDRSRWFQEWTIQPLQGQYALIQLQKWHNRFIGDWRRQYSAEETSEYLELVALPRHFHGHPEEVFYGDPPPTITDVERSTGLNRIVIQINPDADAAAARTALDIPLEAVIIEVGPPCIDYRPPTREPDCVPRAYSCR